MTLNAKITVFYGFSFQEQIAPKSIDIDMEKLRIKFLALNVDFDGPSLDFLRSNNSAHEGIK